MIDLQPDEIVAVIFMKIPKEEQNFFRLLQVCKKFYRIVKVIANRKPF